jgi:hypothetical protein
LSIVTTRATQTAVVREATTWGRSRTVGARSSTHRGSPSPQGIDAAHAAVLRWCAGRYLAFLNTAVYVAVAFATMLWVCVPPSDHDENT